MSRYHLLSQYESDEDETNDEEIEVEPETASPKKKRKPKSVNEWKLEAKFDDVEDARMTIDSENSWSVHFKNQTSEGLKIYYRCNQVKKSGPQCPSRLILLLHSEDLGASLYRNTAEHLHSNKKAGLSDDVKKRINELYKLHTKPKNILNSLADEGFENIKKSQIAGYLSKMKEKLLGPNYISMGSLEEWCLLHSEEPEDEDTAFVLDHQISYGDEDDDDYDDENESTHFR